MCKRLEKERIIKKAPILAVLVCTFFIFFLTNTHNVLADSKSFPKYKLTKLWEAKSGISIPESVLYYPSEDIIFVSNINGNPSKKDGQGFISKLSLSGEILKLKWTAGLNAPKGSGISGDRLYVADIDEVLEIDIKTGKIVERYKPAGAGFLNDITVDKDGNVYISDMSRKNSVIYRLTNKKLEVWLKGPEISSPNGLFAEESRLVVGNFGDGSLKAVSFATKEISVIAKIGSGIDGVQSDGKGNYFISDWRGKTSYVTSSGQVTVLLDTTDQKINSADIEYIEGKQILLIPTFLANGVAAYKVEEE